jgi:uncharacterized HAD superfamily protein
MIYIDLDDTVCYTAVRLAAFASEMFNREYSEENIFDYDLRVSFNLDEEAYRTYMKAFHNTELLKIKIFPHAANVITLWKENGWEPTIVTGRPTYTNETTRQWLAAEGLEDIPIVHVDKYGSLYSCYEDKLITPFPKLKEMDVKFALDDAPNAFELMSQLELCPSAIVHRPWNKKYRQDNPPYPITRVFNWLEINKLVTDHFQSLTK